MENEVKVEEKNMDQQVFVPQQRYDLYPRQNCPPTSNGSEESTALGVVIGVAAAAAVFCTVKAVGFVRGFLKSREEESDDSEEEYEEKPKPVKRKTARKRKKPQSESVVED